MGRHGTTRTTPSTTSTHVRGQYGHLRYAAVRLYPAIAGLLVRVQSGEQHRRSAAPAPLRPGINIRRSRKKSVTPGPRDSGGWGLEVGPAAARAAAREPVLPALDEAGIGLASATFEVVGLPPLRVTPDS